MQAAPTPPAVKKGDAFARWGRTMVRFRWPVVGAWLLLVVLAGAFLAPKAAGVLKAGGIVAVGSESDRAAGILDNQLHASTANNMVVDFQATSEDDLKRAELVTLPVVLILLLIFFRSLVAAIVPLVLGATSVVLANAILFVVGSRVDVSVFALNVASMIGLGLAIDFSL